MCCSYGAIIKIKYRAKSIKNKDGFATQRYKKYFRYVLKKGASLPFLIPTLFFVLYALFFTE